MRWQEATSTMLKTLVGKDRIGLITDVDGTISPIVPDPDAARVTPRSRELLHQLHDHLALVAVITGRATADVQSMVGLPDLVYIGNHGMERWEDGRVEVMPEVAAFRPAIEAALAEARHHHQPGMIFQDKGATVSVHYRKVADPQRIKTGLVPVLEEIAARHGLESFSGRMVFEIRPPIEANKGTAFRYLVESYRLEGALYLGDDTTDVDAMQAARDLREGGQCYALAVGVESEGTPPTVRENADLLAAGVPGVEAFLEWLLGAVELKNPRR
jgi:trehalose 6-phosphate phosphatase